MAMLRLAARGEVPLLFDRVQGVNAPLLTVEAARSAAPALRKTRPLVVMIHGYKFDPFDNISANPHDYLYHFDSERADADRWGRPASWPLGLGFSEGDRWGKDGLCVGFAWSSRPRTRFGRFCAAYIEAERAGVALLRTLKILADAFPAREIDIFTHSLGARVALTAMRLAAETGETALIGRLGRVLLLGPAELVCAARSTMKALDHAAPRRSPQIFSIVARENDFFDVLVERFAPKVGSMRPICLGATGLGRDRSDWLDLQLDSEQVMEWLAIRNVEIGGGRRRACHWGLYNRPGTMDFYSGILRDRQAWSIRAMMQAGVPTHLERRWAHWPTPRFLSRRRAEGFAEADEAAI